MSLEKQTLETVPYGKTIPSKQSSSLSTKERLITSEKLFSRPVFAIKHEDSTLKVRIPSESVQWGNFSKIFSVFKVKTQCHRDEHEADGQYSCHRVACRVHMKSRSTRSPLNANHRCLGRKNVHQFLSFVGNVESFCFGQVERQIRVPNFAAPDPSKSSTVVTQTLAKLPVHEYTTDAQSV